MAAVPQQRVAATRTASGLYQVFFRDEHDRLHSFGSADLTDWLDLTRYDPNDPVDQSTYF